MLVRDRFPDNLLAPADANELLPDTGNPVYQKEIRNEIFGRGTLFLRLIIQISMFLSVVFLTFLFLGMEYIFVDFLVIFTMLVAPAFACNTFTQERERGTLDLLLTTLIRPARSSLRKIPLVHPPLDFPDGPRRRDAVQFYSVHQRRQCESFAVARDVPVAIYFPRFCSDDCLQETTLAMFFSLLFSSTVKSMITTYSVVLILFASPVAARPSADRVRRR